ncbi:uncharacterized protein V6R79_002427 [Siganus canaliculatus]
MASHFKIPKKKQPAAPDSAHLHMQSPLSRLQGPAPQLKGFQSGRGGADKVHAGNSLGSSLPRQSTPCRAPYGSAVVKKLLGIRGGASAAGSWSSQSDASKRAEPTCLSNGWRPKRASDRLLQDHAPSETPPQKKRGDLQPQTKPVSVQSLDLLVELRDQRSSRSSSDSASEDDFVSLTRTRTKPPPRHAPSVTSPARGRGLDVSVPGEKERQRWVEFREKKKKVKKSPSRRQTPAEPIVLSSEEEGQEEDCGGGGGGGGGGRLSGCHLGNSERTQVLDQVPDQGLDQGLDQDPPPSFLQLEFSSLHAGLTQAEANGEMMVTESGITIPLKGSEDVQVTVVASQLRGYGVWDGGVAQGGALLAGCKGPAPSLLFLWVTEAQANLVQMELSAIQTAATAGLSCSFLLLVLKEQLQELQAALLASILDMEEYRRGCSSSGLPSPLEWTDGLLLLHSAPPPLDQHLLGLLGCSASSPDHHKTRRSTRNSTGSSTGRQQLPTRLIQYPSAPCKGRISVSTEDLACLGSGEFLNDVIIDFYLKYLLLEGVGGSVAERSHVFSSFFYKQLSRRRAAGEDAAAASVPDRHMRHQRVKTWTRHVDIFAKDFLFVPVNQEAHWFLVVVCFPGLEEVQHQVFSRPPGLERASGNSDRRLRPPQTPGCTRSSCQRDTVVKRPCILVMDSLKLSHHDNVCRLLRDYLQVEWEVHRTRPRPFTADNMRSCTCRVPQQDNSSDCGVFLLQYVESFLQDPVVNFDLPLRLDHWFPRQRVRQKREQIRSLIMELHRSQTEER